MRSISSYILFFIASCLLMVSCQDDYLEWSPTMWDTTRHPFDAGRFINMCYYNQEPSALNRRHVWSTSSLHLKASNYSILEPDYVAFISGDTLYVRSRYLNYRIQKGRKTFISAQTIIPMLGGEIIQSINEEEKYDELDESDETDDCDEYDEYDDYDEQEVIDDIAPELQEYEEYEEYDEYEGLLYDFQDDPSSEYMGEPLKSVRGDFFSLKTFLSQAEKDQFPMADISLPPIDGKISMPSFLCSRIFTSANILPELGIDQIPIDTSVLLSADKKTIALRYIFNTGAILTVMVDPLLLSNYSISYENGQFAHTAMNLMRYALYETSPVNELPHIYFYLEHTYLGEKQNLYAADKDPTKKEGGNFTHPDENEVPNDWDNIFSPLLKTLWPFLLVFLPVVFIQRQRVIPVLEGYKNRSAEYAKHVGMLYAKEGNLYQILSNRISYFYYDMKLKYGVDLSNTERIRDSASILASHWNINVDEVQAFLSRLNTIRSTTVDYVVSESDLATICEQMNKYSNL